MKAETTSGKLNERAMLVELNIGLWEGRRRDDTTTEEVVTQKGAERDAGAWWVRTIPHGALRPILAAVNKGRTLHWRLTLPWDDAGRRVLPATMFFDFTSEMRKAEKEFNDAVEEFIKLYPTILAEAPKRLGALCTPDLLSRFPTVAELRRRYHWAIQVSPLPQAGDFRVDLGDEATATIRAEIEGRVNETMKVAMQDVWERLYNAVERVVTRLADQDGIFRDSLIENVQALCDLLPKLNVTNDPNLEKMRQEVLAKVAVQVPEDLRKNKKARAATTQKAKAILTAMKGFMGEAKGGQQK